MYNHIIIINSNLKSFIMYTIKNIKIIHAYIKFFYTIILI